MNKETIIDRWIACEDDHSAFYHWMYGYMWGIEDNPGYIHVDENGKERPIDFSGKEENDDGWIKHDGGPCPVCQDAIVDVKMRDGESLDHCQAGHLTWWNVSSNRDIIAYRIVDE